MSAEADLCPLPVTLGSPLEAAAAEEVLAVAVEEEEEEERTRPRLVVTGGLRHSPLRFSGMHRSLSRGRSVLRWVLRQSSSAQELLQAVLAAAAAAAAMVRVVRVLGRRSLFRVSISEHWADHRSQEEEKVEERSR